MLHKVAKQQQFCSESRENYSKIKAPFSGPLGIAVACHVDRAVLLSSCQESRPILSVASNEGT
jgi:hypothetical protein